MHKPSMKDIERQSHEKANETAEMMERAKQIEREITEVKETLKGLPGGLDLEIMQQIEAATEAAKDEASKDGDLLEKAQEKTIIEMHKLCDSIKEKLIENDKASASIENIHSNYGKKALERAHSEIGKNTELGQSVIKKSQEKMSDGLRKIQELRNTIKS